MNVVLTGSSTGIGRALATRLLARGHHVWGLARSDQSDFAALNPAFRFSRCDVASYSDVARAAAEVSASLARVAPVPHIDALVTAAGLQGEIGRTLAADAANWSATVRANLDGTFHAIRAFAHLLTAVTPATSPSLAASSTANTATASAAGTAAPAPRRAKIVCFSGGGATKPRSNFSAYGVAKTAVVRLVETIAEEEHDRPLDINALAPGAINTRLTDEVLALGPDKVGAAEFAAAQKQKAAGGASLDRALDCVEWLLSPASDGITGRLIAAPWDPWPTLDTHRETLARSDIFTLRRVTPEDRGQTW